MYRKGLSIFVVILLLKLSFAVEEGKTLSALPPDGLSLSGSWDCAGAFASKRTHRATFTGNVVLGGKWLELDERDTEPATGYVGKYLIGYDTQQKRLVEFDANNFGAAIYFSTDGWQNHTLIMTSAVSEGEGAAYAANRFVYSITASNSFTVDWQISKTSALAWTTADHLACTRQKVSN